MVPAVPQIPVSCRAGIGDPAACCAALCPSVAKSLPVGITCENPFIRPRAACLDGAARADSDGDACMRSVDVDRGTWCGVTGVAKLIPDENMSNYNAPFEIHVHGQVLLRPDTTYEQLQEALGPLWKYAGARSLADGAGSVYEEEPGIQFDTKERLLQVCWTVRGDEDFRQSLDDMCMGINELAEQGAAIEVTFYDTEFDEEEESEEAESRDDFVMLFVGPTPAAIMQVQRDLLVQDVVNLMERHFDGSELGGVVQEIDKLFSQRFDALVSSLEIGKPPRGMGGSGSGHGGNRRPRHLH